MLFTRQNLPPLQRGDGVSADDVLKGAYIVSDVADPEVVLLATGSEVHVAQQAAAMCSAKVRVVSMPCQELFLEQSEEYRESVLPADLRTVVVEAGISAGWERFTGRDGCIISKDSFGASAPGGLLAEKFGFTAEQVAQKLEALM